jgi:uncharacterized protein YbjT (DUF2867 family)
MGLKVIITGATGMVGEGVMLQCINNPAIDDILLIGRRPAGFRHAKVHERVVSDVADISSISSEIQGYDACFFCLGVSSVGKKEGEFTSLTYDLTLGFARTLQKASPGLTFCYVSGSGTDGTEKGRVMWARVKGRTENDLLKLFPKAYMFRPGYMHPTKGAKNTNKYYKYFTWMYPGLRLLFPGFASTLAELGDAMIVTAIKGHDKPVLEVKDIVKQARAL